MVGNPIFVFDSKHFPTTCQVQLHSVVQHANSGAERTVLCARFNIEGTCAGGTAQKTIWDIAPLLCHVCERWVGSVV